MRQIHRAGEKLFVDFAEPTLPITTERRAHVFIDAMGASSYTFACATPAKTMEDWLGGIARALTVWGGMPQLIVPDNPRATIADPDRYEPRAGDTMLDFARHYGTSSLPARVYRPLDKTKGGSCGPSRRARFMLTAAHFTWRAASTSSPTRCTTTTRAANGRLARAVRSQQGWRGDRGPAVFGWHIRPRS